MNNSRIDNVLKNIDTNSIYFNFSGYLLDNNDIEELVEKLEHLEIKKDIFLDLRYNMIDNDVWVHLYKLICNEKIALIDISDNCWDERLFRDKGEIPHPEKLIVLSEYDFNNNKLEFLFPMTHLLYEETHKNFHTPSSEE